MVTRKEGYRRGVPKEEAALQVVEAFFAAEADVTLERIWEREKNYRNGDFLMKGSLSTIECKGQPINPSKYSQNFVEIFEVTSKIKHASGLKDTAQILGISLDAISAAKVADRRAGASGCTQVGRLPFVSASLTSISGSDATIYVNALDGGKFLYLYTREELLSACRLAILRSGFVRGAGMSNEDTFAVFVPLPELTWQRKGGVWEFTGTAEEKWEGIVKSGLFR
jgi:hypothetical protein